MTFAPLFAILSPSFLILRNGRIFLWFDKLTILNPERSRRIMKKGRILFLVLAFLAVFAWTDKAYAEETNPEVLLRENACQSTISSTSLCEEPQGKAFLPILSQLLKIKKTEAKLTRAKPSVIISSSKDVPLQSNIQLQLETISNPSEPQIQPAPQEQNLDSNKIFDLINQFRTSQNLPPFELENSVCELAQIRSTELAGELATRTLHTGLYNRSLPYWIWENAKVGSNEEETVSWWLSSPIHRQSIVGDFKYSCVKCTGSNCSQLFTSFVPK